MISSDTLSIMMRSSIFSGHDLSLVHKDLSPILHFNSEQYWPILLLFLVLSIYVAVKIADTSKIVKVFLSVFSLQAAKQLYREDYKLSKRVSVFLTLCFVLVFSFLIYSINHRFGIMLKDVNSFVQYLFFMFLIVGMYTVKIVVNYFLSTVFYQTDLAKEYTFNIFVFCQIVGVLLFPFILFMQFSTLPDEWFIYPSIVLIIAALSLRLFRGVAISTIDGGVGILYIFLYLCALEVIPLLVLIKFLVINF